MRIEDVRVVCTNCHHKTTIEMMILQNSYTGIIIQCPKCNTCRFNLMEELAVPSDVRLSGATL